MKVSPASLVCCAAFLYVVNFAASELLPAEFISSTCSVAGLWESFTKEDTCSIGLWSTVPALPSTEVVTALESQPIVRTRERMTQEAPTANVAISHQECRPVSQSHALHEDMPTQVCIVPGHLPEAASRVNEREPPVSTPTISLKGQTLLPLSTKPAVQEDTSARTTTATESVPSMTPDHTDQSTAATSASHHSIDDKSSPSPTLSVDQIEHPTPSIQPHIPIGRPSTVNQNMSKERFNYASFDCGALILANNRGANSATSILHNNKDAYMLNKCSAKRFVVVELCEDILVDTVMLANFEFFSSMFKDFQIYASDRYPPKDNEWTLLGQFRAKNIRDFQYFKVHNPRIWARYLRVNFLSEYGHEYYCPLSMLRVYGTTMMEEMKAEEDNLAITSGAIVPQPTGLIPSANASYEPSLIPILNPDRLPFQRQTSTRADNVRTSPSLPLPGHVASAKSKNTHSGAATDHHGTSPTPHALEKLTGYSAARPSFPPDSLWNEWKQNVVDPTQLLIPEQFYARMSTEPEGLAPESGYIRQSPGIVNADGVSSNGNQGNGGTNGEQPVGNPTGSSGGGTQESIFKTIMKRLSILERNATLSYIYLEEQSKVLNEIFTRAGLREQERFDAFLAHCNRTLFRIYTDLHTEYTRTWGMLRSDLESQKISVDAKMSEIGQLLEHTKEQMSRQLLLQTIMVVGALFLGLTVSRISSILAWTKASLPIHRHESSPVPIPSNGQPPEVHIESAEPSVSLPVTPQTTPQHSPARPAVETKTSVKKKRKRRRSTVTAVVRTSGIEASRSENDIYRLQHERRGSLSPSVLRTLDTENKLNILSRSQNQLKKH
ncbi:hypothetical protein SpCBS45565_g03095 [Spizellomyces sp. 'palustris']|nr:hypothetical protein SpCBS45565_g03095 [Spizellomyces sp. 'palustris']